MNLYLAGPMRGHRHFNFPAFDRAAAALQAYGHYVFNPAEYDRTFKSFDPVKENMTGTMAELDACGFSLADVMMNDFSILANGKTTGIVLLEGWEESSGARAEALVAKLSGLDLFLWDSGVIGALRQVDFEITAKVQSQVRPC